MAAASLKLSPNLSAILFFRQSILQQAAVEVAELLLAVGFHLLRIILVHLDVQAHCHKGEFVLKGFLYQEGFAHTAPAVKGQKFGTL